VEVIYCLLKGHSHETAFLLVLIQPAITLGGGLCPIKGTVLCNFWPLLVTLLFIFGEKVDRIRNSGEGDNGWEIY
jgi:hypothetical protein